MELTCDRSLLASTTGQYSAVRISSPSQRSLFQRDGLELLNLSIIGVKSLSLFRMAQEIVSDRRTFSVMELGSCYSSAHSHLLITLVN